MIADFPRLLFLSLDCRSIVKPACYKISFALLSVDGDIQKFKRLTDRLNVK